MKTLADYCHCRVCRRATLPVGFLRVCLRLNPRFIFAVGIIAACAAAPNLLARPTANLLDRIAFIESSNRSDAIGDGGKARGAYQMHLAAVIDCGGTRADWMNLTNRQTADKFAGLYLNKISAQLARENIQPSPAIYYLCWNMGFGGARRIGFDPSKAPKTTRNAIAKL